MSEPIQLDIGNVRYFLQHIGDLRNITRDQVLSLAASSIGAVVTAGLIVQPLNWHLIIAAFAGALLTSVVHLLQSLPASTQLEKAVIQLHEIDPADKPAVEVATAAANQALDKVLKVSDGVTDKPADSPTVQVEPAIQSEPVVQPVLSLVKKEGTYYGKLKDR